MEQQAAAARTAAPSGAAAMRAARVRGLRQMAAIQALMEQRTSGSPELGVGIRAAEEAAAFAFSEGWVAGPLWLAYGSRWILARWALERGITAEEVAAFFSNNPAETEGVEGQDEA